MGSEVSQFDVAIVGGGPAGMSAALWCDELDLRVCLLERASDVGGQLHLIHNQIENYPGAKFRNGAECSRRFKDSLAGRRITLMSDQYVDSIDVETRSVLIRGAGRIHAKAIVLATGVRRRTLGVAGEDEYKTNGILESGSRDRQEAAGLRVAVIGGGDAALENALILAEHAEKVYLIHRRDGFSARREFVRAVGRHARIECVFNARVKEFGGAEHLEFVDVERRGVEPTRIEIDNAVIRIGVEPNSELLMESVEVDDTGYITVNAFGRTSAAGIYAVGDVAHQVSPTIATAVGSGASAIKSIAAEIRKRK